jgi:hypothetical protein
VILETNTKHKSAPPLPGVRQGWIVFGLMILAVIILIGQLFVPVYTIVLIPPLTRVGVSAILILPFLWIPFLIIWRSTLAETAWLKFLYGIASFMICTTCWALAALPTVAAGTSMECFATSDTTYTCVYAHPTENLQAVLKYKRIGNMPLMQLIQEK